MGLLAAVGRSLCLTPRPGGGDIWRAAGVSQASASLSCVSGWLCPRNPWENVVLGESSIRVCLIYHLVSLVAQPPNPQSLQQRVGQRASTSICCMHAHDHTFCAGVAGI